MSGNPLLRNVGRRRSLLGGRRRRLRPRALGAWIDEAVDKAVVTPVTYLGSRAIPSSVATKIRDASSYTIDRALSTVITGNPKKQLPSFDLVYFYNQPENIMGSSNPFVKNLKAVRNSFTDGIKVENSFEEYLNLNIIFY